MDNFLREIRQKAEGCPELMKVFTDCCADTWNTAVKEMEDGTAHVITGDIPAMWLRDSAAQMRPFLFFAKEDGEMRERIAGVVRRQFMYIAMAVQGLTSKSQEEKLAILKRMAATTGGKGVMHEGSLCDDDKQYTREWFSWANAMYMELFLDYLGYRLETSACGADRLA